MTTPAASKPRRGWSSVGLKTVGDNENLWTVADAARLLGPPNLNAQQVRNLVKIFGMEPQGKRNVTGPNKGGRHTRVYNAEDFIKAYDALQKH